jgi:hypothetical protein
LAPKLNKKLCVILRVTKLVFNPYTKVRCDEKVSDECQVNNSILRVIRVNSNYLVIRDIVIGNRTGLIRHSKLRKRLSESCIECKGLER